MPKLTVTNISTRRVTVGTYMGTIEPGKTKVRDITVERLESSRNALVGLEQSGVITWAYTTTDERPDDDAEFVTLSQLGSPRAFSMPTSPERTITADLSAIEDDWSPAGLSSSNVIRVNPTGAGFSLRGLAGGLDGRLLYLVNVGAFSFDLLDDNANSLPENRFSTRQGLPIVTIPVRGVCSLLYDDMVLRWRIASRML